ncbi:MAG: chromosome segregation protein SMC [Chloroflexota bacterium]
MLIKRVVIQGFKTFAKKTEFIFDPGVTAIVGPNGSGKSNVVDAVRWCLGEQSFSLLRSKKTSDVIFAGSDKRARMGMAQVSLTLDNTQAEVPIDFVEIEVTRRAYRDGGNEYLLNGKKVRLQDITQLLAQTGLGKRTYALVGQGLIDKVLHLSAEDRRAIFEEAAGITGYQSKRATTLRRLEATEKNLVRIQDIISELSPRLGYLKRQADRAKERVQVAADLHSMLSMWYGYRWHNALRALAEHRASEVALKQEVEVRQAAIKTFDEQIGHLRIVQTSLRETLGELHSRSGLLHRQAEQVGRTLAVVQERLRQTIARQEENQRELVPLHLQQQTIAERIIELQGVVTEAERVAAANQVAVASAQKVLTVRQQERSQRQKAVDEARHHLTQIQNKLAQKKSLQEQLQERLDGLYKEQASIAQTQVEADEAVNTAQMTLQMAEDALNTGEAESQTVQSSLNALDAELTQTRQQLTEAERQRQQADRICDQLQTRYDLLNRLRTEGAGYASGVRTVLQAHTQGKLQGVIGTVASLVAVPAHLEKAIETALGGAFQNVVTDTWDDARAAIDYLKQSGRGRATFLPLNRLNVLPLIDAPQMSGILGNAADLVDYDEDVEDVVDQLLGRVWVAESLSAARQALDHRGNRVRPTVVTIGGEIVRPGGAVTGGRDGNRRDDSVLAREREFRELPAQIQAANQQRQQAVTRCTDLHAQTEQHQRQITLLQQQQKALAHRERQLRQQVEDARRQLDRAEQSAQWQQTRAGQMSAEIQGLVERQAATSAEVTASETILDEAQQALVDAETALNEVHIDELLQEIADLRAGAAEAQGHLNSQRGLYDGQQREAKRVAQQIEDKTARVEQLGQERVTLQEQVDAQSREETQLSQQLAVLRHEIEPVEEQVTTLAKQQATLEEQERTEQKLLRRDEQAWNNAQLQLQRAQDVRSQLEHDIENDFGLMVLEVSETVPPSAPEDESTEQSTDAAFENAEELESSSPNLSLESLIASLQTPDTIPETLEADIRRTRNKFNRVSSVNPDALHEYEEATNRHEFLITQSEDLEQGAAELRKIIHELDQLMEKEFDRTFKAVAEQFILFFQRLFNGGTAKLMLTDPNNLTQTGIDIVARPPGKRPQSLALLSGGERTLSACALIFAILRVSPTPFCVFDEVDAALDEANIDRFRETLETLSDDTQFILVTHNRRTLEGTDMIYGITMSDDGISQMISLQLDGDKIVNRSAAAQSNTDKQLQAVAEVVQM